MSVNIFGSSGGGRLSSDVDKKYVDQKFATLSTNLATKVSKSGDIMTGELDMNGQQIIGLVNPTDDDEACNKKYVDSKIKSESTSTKAYIDMLILNIGVNNKVCYVPILNSNLDSKYGFKVTASSETENQNKHAFNVFSYKNTEWITNNENKNFWIQIQCPESVKIYKFALRGKNSGTDLIYKWKLQGSNNVYANRWDNLYIAENKRIDKVMNYYYIQSTEKYSTYRIFVHQAEGENPGLSYWQLYTVDNIVSF